MVRKKLGVFAMALLVAASCILTGCGTKLEETHSSSEWGELLLGEKTTESETGGSKNVQGTEEEGEASQFSDVSEEIFSEDTASNYDKVFNALTRTFGLDNIAIRYSYYATKTDGVPTSMRLQKSTKGNGKSASVSMSLNGRNLDMTLVEDPKSEKNAYMFLSVDLPDIPDDEGSMKYKTKINVEESDSFTIDTDTFTDLFSTGEEYGLDLSEFMSDGEDAFHIVADGNTYKVSDLDDRPYMNVVVKKGYVESMELYVDVWMENEGRNSMSQTTTVVDVEFSRTPDAVPNYMKDKTYEEVDEETFGWYMIAAIMTFALGNYADEDGSINFEWDLSDYNWESNVESDNSEWDFGDLGW